MKTAMNQFLTRLSELTDEADLLCSPQSVGQSGEATLQCFVSAGCSSLGPSRFRSAPRLILVHHILEDLEGIEARVIVLTIDDSLDRPAINIDLFGKRVELSLIAQPAQPFTQALEIVHGVAIEAGRVADVAILDIYASRRKANMTCATR